MNSFLSESSSLLSRRRFVRGSLFTGAAISLPTFAYSETPVTANGSADPYPIPWLDKNGSHNQSAGPNLEPSHIFHFKGLVARCSTFTGIGTDNQGNRVMRGEYWAARSAQQGVFTHI